MYTPLYTISFVHSIIDRRFLLGSSETIFSCVRGKKARDFPELLVGVPSLMLLVKLLVCWFAGVDGQTLKPFYLREFKG